MCTERVVFYRSAPVVVLHLRALGLWTDTVHPVVLVGKAAARPSEDRYLQRLEGFEDIFPIALYVWDRGVFANPQTAIDA